jgi:uncharacterized protein (TIGR02646 family)
MIKVEKNFDDVPNILSLNPKENAKSRKVVFEKNILSKKYIDTKNSYKTKSVQDKLKKIYNSKCAYCEKNLLDSPKHIEHYRPKNIYYWLAYSWDNLLLSCGECNSTKGTKFDTINKKVIYNNEQFEDIHNLSKNYDKLELPKIINPEKEDILDKLIYDNDGKIDSLDYRVKYTIDKVCKLNRNELVQKRIQILNDFKNYIEDCYNMFLANKVNIKVFKPIIKKFQEDCKKENEFYSFRYFILNNIKIFFDNKHQQKIISSLLINNRNIINAT